MYRPDYHTKMGFVNCDRVSINFPRAFDRFTPVRKNLIAKLEEDGNHRYCF